MTQPDRKRLLAGEVEALVHIVGIHCGSGTVVRLQYGTVVSVPK